MKFLCLTFVFLCAFIIPTQAQQDSSAKSEAVFVIGAVVKASELKFEKGLTLTQAIDKVGGLSKQKKGETVKIYRRIQGTAKPELIEINLKQIRKGKADDFILQPFDIIEVPSKKRIPRGFYEIKTPTGMLML